VTRDGIGGAIERVRPSVAQFSSFGSVAFGGRFGD
jgi:hypothetical protein